MRIIFFVHPDFIGHQSMPRFARLLSEGMQKRGHEVDLWSPQPKFYNFSVPQKLKKWMGYIDQYLLFPNQFKRKIKTLPSNTLYVFTDHALGPWVPFVTNRLNVVHCHDFLAQRSALDEIAENPTGWSGKKYQAYIRNGYRQSKNFISVSKKTQNDLSLFLTSIPLITEVVYNGLNQVFIFGNKEEQRRQLGAVTGLNLRDGYLLHVGGNQWYKNRVGVIELYIAWRAQSISISLPLLLIGEEPSKELLAIKNNSVYNSDIHFLTTINDRDVRIAYAGASVFVFPSLAEGFGWPIAEAMASGCPVITTNEAPMTEVAGDAAFLLPRMPSTQGEVASWAIKGGATIESVVNLKDDELQQVIQTGIENAKRFDPDKALDSIEKIYLKIVKEQSITT